MTTDDTLSKMQSGTCSSSAYGIEMTESSQLCQQPLAKAQGLASPPKGDAIGRLTATRQTRMYRDWQEKHIASPEYS